MMHKLLTLFRTLERLKRTPRTGWVDRGVPPADVESVADHTLLTALIAWITATDDPALDADRVLKLALIHDMAEAIVGDHPPYEPHEVPPRDDIDGLRAFFSVRHLRTADNAARKRQAEDDAAAALIALMPDAIAGEISGLWQEYEAQSTPEARFVKQVDRLEAFLQSRTYAAADPDLPLWGFSDMAAKEIDHPALTAIRDAALARERDEP
jgi:putative hydrolase of HD superfamily